MSQAIERALRRQQEIQRSRGVAWITFLTMLPIAFFSLISFGIVIEAGAFLSIGSLISLAIAIAAIWIAVHLFREARRLDKLLRDPELIMRLERDPDLIAGVHWSSFNPFSGWRE